MQYSYTVILLYTYTVIYTKLRANLSFKRRGKIIYIAANADLAEKVYFDEEVALDAMGLED